MGQERQSWVATNLDELKTSAICRATRKTAAAHNWCSKIHDRFWPLPKNSSYPAVHLSRRRSFIQESTRPVPCPSPVFRPAFRRPTREDRNRPSSTRRLTGADHTSHPAGDVPASMSPCSNAGSRTPITSLEYFAGRRRGKWRESAIPESYWEPLRTKVHPDGAAVAESSWRRNPDVATRGAVTLTAPHRHNNCPCPHAAESNISAQRRTKRNDANE